MARAAAAIEPVSPMASSNRDLPGPSAIESPISSRIRGRGMAAGPRGSGRRAGSGVQPLEAGVEVGDFVVEINGVEIRSVVDFQQTLYYFSGVRVPVRFFRDGEEYLKLMTIERRPPEANRP